MTPTTFLLFLGLGIDPATAAQSVREQEEAARFPNFLRAKLENETWDRHIRWMRDNRPYPAGGNPLWWDGEIQRAQQWEEYWRLVGCAQCADNRPWALARLKEMLPPEHYRTGWHPGFIGGVVRRAVDLPDGRKVVIEE
jgi:hypothetical protein